MSLVSHYFNFIKIHNFSDYAKKNVIYKLMESQLDKLSQLAYLSTDLTIQNCEILKNTSYKVCNNVDGMTGQLLPKRYC